MYLREIRCEGAVLMQLTNVSKSSYNTMTPSFQILSNSSHISYFTIRGYRFRLLAESTIESNILLGFSARGSYSHWSEH
jgi:hypothetical protein